MKNQLINPLEFEKYDKISDDIYSLAPNCSLRFNVTLSRGYNNKRYHFHKEFEYPSKYNGLDTVVTIKRSYDYFLTIENNMKPDNTDKCYIRIYPADYFIFKKGLDTALSWFQDKKYSNLFSIDSKGIWTMNAPYPDFTIAGLVGDRYIKIDPTIIRRGYNDIDNIPGITMVLSDPNNVIAMPVDRLAGLIYILSTFNMVLSAQLMINYLGCPPVGYNRYKVETRDYGMDVGMKNADIENIEDYE